MAAFVDTKSRRFYTRIDWTLYFHDMCIQCDVEKQTDILKGNWLFLTIEKEQQKENLLKNINPSVLPKSYIIYDGVINKSL